MILDGTPNGFAIAFAETAQAHPDKPAFEFENGVYSYKQMSDLVAAFAIKMTQAGVDADTVVQSASIDPVVVLPTMLAATALGARYATPSAHSDAPYIGKRCILTTSDMDSGNGVSTLLVDQSFSPTLFDQTGKDAIWRAVHADQPTLRLLHNARLVNAQLIAVWEIYGTGLVEQDLRVAILHSPTDWRYLIRAAALFVSGGTLIDSADADADAVLAAGPNLIAGNGASLGRFLSTAEAAAPLPQAELSAPELWQTDTTKLARGYGRLVVTFEHQDFGILYRNAYVWSDFGHMEHEKGSAPAHRVSIVNSQGKPVEGNALGVLMACGCEPMSAALPIGYIGNWESDNSLRVLGYDLVDNAGQLIDAENLAMIDATLRTIDGISDAAAFHNPKAGTNGLLAFAVFQGGVNRIQASEMALHNCRKNYGGLGTPKKIWPLNAIPLLRDGRPDRAQCRKLIEDALGRN